MPTLTLEQSEQEAPRGLVPKVLLQSGRGGPKVLVQFVRAVPEEELSDQQVPKAREVLAPVGTTRPRGPLELMGQELCRQAPMA